MQLSRFQKMQAALIRPLTALLDHRHPVGVFTWKTQPLCQYKTVLPRCVVKLIQPLLVQHTEYPSLTGPTHFYFPQFILLIFMISKCWNVKDAALIYLVFSFCTTKQRILVTLSIRCSIINQLKINPPNSLYLSFVLEHRNTLIF